LEILLSQKIQKYKISPAKKVGPSSFRVSRGCRFYKNRKSEGGCEKNDRKTIGVAWSERHEKCKKSCALKTFVRAKKR